MGTISVITSGKGGTGKSTVTVGLGSALAQRSQTVLLMDVDAGLRSLDIMTGVAERAVFDLSDIFAGTCEPIRAIYASPVYEGVSVIPSPSDLSDMCSPDDLRRLCAGLSQYYDHVLIDCPAGVGEGFECAAFAAQRALVVSTGDMVSARDAHIVSTMLARRGIPARLVINRLRPDLIFSGVLPDIDEIMDAVGLPLFGVVPDDDELIISLTGGHKIPQASNAFVCFSNMAARYMGEQVPLAALEKM